MSTQDKITLVITIFAISVPLYMFISEENKQKDEMEQCIKTENIVFVNYKKKYVYNCKGKRK